MKNIFLKKYFTKEHLRNITNKITEIENFSSVELRIVLKTKRKQKEKNLPIRDLAIQDFFRFGIHNTKHKTGILIYILLKERKFEIIADEGICKVIPQQKWNELASRLSYKFSKDNYFEGLLDILEEIKSIAANNFPRVKDDINELPDEVIVK
ncbi:MAG: TPM domain-containing protein [Ignavibacteria bacterium]